jgi:undecaprenyl-diphosphatase
MMQAQPMSWIEALVLGTVQGLTEFLPISSTAHLRVVPALCGWGDPGVVYSAVIQLGSLVALLAYFWKDLWMLAAGSLSALMKRDFNDMYFRQSAAIILGTLPICVLGLLLKDVLETDNGPFRSLMLIGGASIVMSVLLLIAEKVSKRDRDMTKLGIQDGLLIGLGQAMALVPGCSRSGSTLTFALFLNIKRDDAARFSFLLGIPAVFLSGILELKKLLSEQFTPDSMQSVAIGFISATAISYAAIWWMIKFLKDHSTMIFVIYRLAFGIAVVALSATHAIH